MINPAATPNARVIVAVALADALEPLEPIPPSKWAPDNLKVPDGEYAGAALDLSLTPHLIEPLDKLGPDCLDNEIFVMKSAQSAFTTMLLASVGHSIDRDPCDMIIVQPIDSALSDFNSQKLSRLIEKSPALSKKVRPQTSRAGTASKTYEKKFGSHSLFLAISTSSADLSSKTIKKAYLDEIDRYPDDVDGQGSPYSLVVKRQTMFLASGTWKRACISTPTVKGASAIEEGYESGDKRRWFVRCPHCTPADAPRLYENDPAQPYEFVFEYGPNFCFNKTYPYNAYYVAPCCGVVIEGWRKIEVYLSGRWIATAPGPGKKLSYHFDALSSRFVPWDEIAKEAVEAGDDPAKLKPFYNLTLGLPFEIKGDAPDHKLLMQRAEPYKRGHIPPGGLLVTVMCDVQMRGIYYEVVVWTADRRSYTIEADYLDGATTDHDDGAFAALSEVYHRTWPDAYGNRWGVDEFGVDCGYRQHVVTTWTRSHPGTKALKGEDGWHRPPLGIASDADIDYRGKRIKGGAKIRVVGTWPLKGTFYAYLNVELRGEDGALLPPRGYCHFGTFLDDRYFRQLTSEYLAEEKYRGKTRKVWKQRESDNHFLDCRIGNMALADAYLATFTSDDWARRARERGVPDDLMTPDLFNQLPAIEGNRETDGGKVASPAALDPFARLAELNKGL
ncbi:MAG: terminase [Rhodopseudomonas sp.]|nr:terminase [Rhodopseudomonas sp.]